MNVSCSSVTHLPAPIGSSPAASPPAIAKRPQPATQASPTDQKHQSRVHPALAELTQLAAELCQTPIAFMSVLGAERQFFTATVGIDSMIMPRDQAFCIQTLQTSDLLLVPDTLQDDRFCQNGLVTQAPHLRFYAGAPLITRAGDRVGSLCVADTQARTLTPQQQRQLQILSHQVVAQLELAQLTERPAPPPPRPQPQATSPATALNQQELILFNLANQIRNSLNLDTILQTAVNEIQRFLQVDYCHFLWCLPDQDEFQLIMTHEAKWEHLPSLSADLQQQSHEIADHITRSQIWCRDDAMIGAEVLNQPSKGHAGVRSQLLVPLKTHAGQLGAILCSYQSQAHAWTTRETQILQAVTNHLAIALDQAELFAATRATALAAQTQAQYLAEALQKLQQTQAQLIQHEKMSSLGQLVAGVAHEINNPVNFISGNITYAADYINDVLSVLALYREHYPEPIEPIQTLAETIDLDFIATDLPRLVSSMKIGVERIYQIVLSLRNFSRLDEAEMKPVDIHEGLENTLMILQNRLKRNQAGVTINVVREYQALPLVECSAGQLNQVFMNLLGNAIDALDEVSENPTIAITTELVHAPILTHAKSSNKLGDSQPQHILVRIHDNGCGMTEAVLQKVFNPFFTTKPVGKGTGLGLSISYQIIVDKHQGSLTCKSQPGSGTEFHIQIPVRSKMMKS